jgi:hypothetical protein
MSDKQRNTVQQLDTVVTELNRLHDSHALSWRKISALPKYQGIPAGTLCAIAKGREPKKNKHRLILGLPPLGTAEICTNPTCDGYGQPHTFDCQTEQVKQKPQPRPKRETRTRIAADVSKEQRERLKELAASYGMTFSEFIRALADGEFWPMEPK